MLDKTFHDRPAEIHYLSGDYRVLRPGTHVLCAVSGVRIPIDELKYWSAERQEAYASAETSLKRHLESTGQVG